jgi:NAD(P)H-dependent FMN reductase
MPHIVIISASVRTARVSHRVALYLQDYLTRQQLASAEIADLNAYKFPLFSERFSHQANPVAEVVGFRNKILAADGIIIVTPEYNGGYPASLKNVIDLLYTEWYRKPISIATVSDGSFGGTQVITSLLFTLWKIKAWVVPPSLPVPNANIAFTEDGKAKEEQQTEKRVGAFVKELLWAIERKRQSSSSEAM